MTDTRTAPRLPRWVAPVSALVIALQHRGVAFFTFQVLEIVGRKSGRVRSTVVSPFAVDGRLYVLSFGTLAWVQNARAASRATLARGRRRNDVRLVEIKPPESRAIAGEFPRQVPAGVRFFVRLGLVKPPGRPEQFAAAADHLTLFRIDPIEAP